MKTVRTKTVGLILIALIAGTSLADETADSAQSEAIANCTNEDSPWRDFDFWIGQWEVFDPESDRKYGDNHIEKKERGCLILEQWRSVDGSTGISMNFYDPLEETWRQVWQSAGIFVDYSGGLDDEGRMLLEGTIFYHANGLSAPFRGRWTKQDDGSVLQQFWQYDSESESWQGWFQGLYRKSNAEQS